MQAFFAVFHTTLGPKQLAAKRRKLAGLLKPHKIKLRTIPADTAVSSALAIIAKEAKSASIVAIDDACPDLEKADWFKQLAAEVDPIRQAYRPHIIYVSEKHTAAGVVTAHLNPMCRQYVWRDRKGVWVDNVADAIVALQEEMREAAKEPEAEAPTGTLGIAGTSDCFCEALEDLADILRSPYGLVTGEPGVGKLFLIRRLWAQIGNGQRLVLLPCGTFFKDYYVGPSFRIVGGGREAIDQIEKFFVEAEDGLLVLHHVERLPHAVQEEFAARLGATSVDPALPTRTNGVDSSGLIEHDVRVIATSAYWPQVLKQTRRVIPDLIRRLSKRHVRIPTLRQRGREDLRLVSEAILTRIDARTREGLFQIDDAVMTALAEGTWPENISSLAQALEQATRRCKGRRITPRHLPKDVFEPQDPNLVLTLDAILERVKRAAIQNALREAGGDKAAAARILGRDPKSMYRLMRSVGIPVSKRRKG